MSKKYQEAGVNLNAGYEAVARIKNHTLKTVRPGWLGNVGSFGGLFDLGSLNIKNPVLVSGTDGVGTKLKIAFALNKHDTIGIDAVAMCVNDVVALGAEPLYFLDYLALGKNEPEKIEQIIIGICEGCQQANCSLIGGETAEMPGMYSDDEYDIAGFAVGVIEKEKIIDGEKVSEGDTVIGITSSGVHSNGFSLVRKIVDDNKLSLHDPLPGSKLSLGEALIVPTKIYVKSVLSVLKQIDVHGICHITGGGFDENIPRMLKKGQGVKIYKDRIPELPIFPYLQEKGNIPPREMYNIFNMGIGLVMIVKKEDSKATLDILHQIGEEAYEIGSVTNSGEIEII